MNLQNFNSKSSKIILVYDFQLSLIYANVKKKNNLLR